jgi:translation initiation factor IF-2
MTKVRIYDLSRELNLDNKQVLDICEELNIAAKTHSSSIPEADAERIRANVEKQGTSNQPENGKRSSEQDGQNQRKRQQPILEVRPNKQRGETSQAQNGQGSGGSPQLKAPPRRPVANTETTKDVKPKPKMKKPSEEKAPSVSPEAPTSEKPTGEKPASPSVEKTPEQPSNQPVEAKQSPSDSPKSPKQPNTNQTQTQSSETKQLIGPPKPKSPPQEKQNVEKEQKQEKKPEKPEKPKKPKKPTLKSSPSKPKPKPDSEEKSREQSSGHSAGKGEKEATPAAKTQEEDSSPSSPKKPAKPKMLAKPKRSKAEKETSPPEEEVAAKTNQDEETSEEETGDDTELLLEQPKRPRPKRVEAPTRQGKKKGWEEEEEETEKTEAKPSKKRRPKPIIEDDDEEELVLEDEEEFDSSEQEEDSISLRSLERPPKPESLQKKASPPPKSSPSKPKKNKGASQQQSQRSQRQEKEERKERPEKITLTQEVAVPELAEMLGVSETEIIKNLFISRGIQANITQTLELETARLVAEDLGVTVEIPEKRSAATKTEMLDTEDLENLQFRPPVITIMGHVDHGKTSLLDSIRKTKVAEGEAGGITQHTGAYHVDVEHEGETKQVVFLDTPGHEAFTAMRARGAKVTDIAVLVVAADDGVQPQTQEAISHAKAAGVPIVVAINKMDKEGAQPDRVKQELTEHQLVPEEWGGNTPMVGVSAITGENLDELLEMIILVAELEELSANPDRLARGTVIEANLDRARGPVATLLVQNGTLHVGNVIVAGSCFGKIRAMIDDRGERVEAAGPSFAVEILGLNDVPSAGDEFNVYADEKEARAIAEKRREQMRNSRLQRAARSRRVTLSGVSEQAQEGELKELNLIIKADVQGSVEAIQNSLSQLPQNEVQIRVLFAAPGEVTETDVDLAAASGAVIIGFNTTLASNAKAAADQEGVDVREYDIIYKLLDEIQGAMEGLLDPEEVESPLGTAEVRAVFPVGRGSVAGCYVQSGRIVRNRRMRVRRNGEVVYNGNIDSLKRVKEDAKEVQSGFECGVGSNKFNDWKEGDIIEAYEMVMKRRTLNPK